MRLLNVNTLTFRDFFDHDIPRFAILSHRWLPSEITYKDFLKNRHPDSAGHHKVLRFCEFVKSRRIFDPSAPRPDRRKQDFNISDRGNRTPVTPAGGEALEWIWIDTVCIDKRSSQELSEAINSMYLWYSSCEECYVYMRDVPPMASTPAGVFWKAFDASDWFTRGWTLQEMLAPATVVFLDCDWKIFGHLQTAEGSKQYAEVPPWSAMLQFELNQRISDITGIQAKYLSGAEAIESASIARRLSWSARRETTRLEDEAYCLLGLFGVNMPLLYGEGRKAFQRLQEEIIKRSDDQSIFAWGHDDPDAEYTGILAPDIKSFLNCGNIVRSEGGAGPWRLLSPYSITNLGLQLSTKTQKIRIDRIDAHCTLHIVQLNCWEVNENVPPAIPHARKTTMVRRKQYRAPPHPELLVELAILECNHYGPPHHARSRLNDLRKHGRTLRSLIVLAERQKAADAALYIRLSTKHQLADTKQSWGECKECRAFEWMLINEALAALPVERGPPIRERDEDDFHLVPLIETS